MDLPLFPLGQTVLAPSMPLPLQIFEPRYREMIAHCLETDRKFGVVLIREGEEVGETASPYEVGTIAEITTANRLDDGRMLIETEGRQRFRIIERFYDRSYLHATVELLDERVGLLENALPLAADLQQLVFRYIGILRTFEDEGELEIDLPREPLDLSYLVLALLQVPDAERQELLEARDAEVRLRREVQILRREVAILERMIEPPSDRGKSYFSPN